MCVPNALSPGFLQFMVLLNTVDRGLRRRGAGGGRWRGVLDRAAAKGPQSCVLIRYNFPNEFHLPTNDALIQLGEDGDRKD